ncbi:hypothetical protein ACTOWA_05030 [Herbaspirillum seropedicae]|uniref:hypothetical protein n=1 Tax=Herbaspirillum seropedicae TaxID=964 RepID=UPI003F8D1F04
MEIARISSAGPIKNPLTIIAIFAGIAEISGTLVLPHIAPDNQRLYIYFLISFPSVLVALFFLTLNLNHRVLYAPSDFQDEDHFMGLIKKASPIDVLEKAAEQRSKAPQEQMKTDVDIDVDEQNPDADGIEAAQVTNVGVGGSDAQKIPEGEQNPPAPIPTDIEKNYSAVGQEIIRKNSADVSSDHEEKQEFMYSRKRRASTASYRVLEHNAITDIAQDFFNDRPTFDVVTHGSDFVYDGAVINDDVFALLDASVINTSGELFERAKKFFEMANRTYKYLPIDTLKKFMAVFIPIYSQNMNSEEQKKCHDELMHIVRSYRFKTALYGMQESELTDKIVSKMKRVAKMNNGGDTFS